jgi:hypothetical protein
MMTSKSPRAQVLKSDNGAIATPVNTLLRSRAENVPAARTHQSRQRGAVGVGEGRWLVSESEIMGPPIVWLASAEASGVRDQRIAAAEFTVPG